MEFPASAFHGTDWSHRKEMSIARVTVVLLFICNFRRPAEGNQLIPCTLAFVTCNEHHHRLAPCHLDVLSRYHTIPHRFHSMEKRHFEGGQRAVPCVPCEEGSKLYKLNIWAMTLGRSKERAVSVAEELAARDGNKR